MLGSRSGPLIFGKLLYIHIYIYGNLRLGLLQGGHRSHKMVGAGSSLSVDSKLPL